MTFLKKTLGVLALAGALVFGTPNISEAGVVASSESGALFNAVDEASDTLRVAANAKLSIFVSGTYATDNIVWLQKATAVGSGAWENVIRVTGTSTVANARVETYWDSGPNPADYRLFMSATGTGAVVAYLTDKNRTAVSIHDYANSATQIVTFDDFMGQSNDGSLTVLNPSMYLTTRGEDQEGTIAAVTVAIQEGAVTIVSGDNLAGSEICMSAITTGSFGALPSDGPIVFEIRQAGANIDGITYMALQAQECAADNVVSVLADMDSGVFVQVDASNADMIGIIRQDEATDTDDWQAFSSLVDTEGANALEVPLGVATSANTYVILRVETDVLGNGYFYVNGALKHAEALAITPGTRLVPAYVSAETAAGGGVVTTTIDYWAMVVARPTS